MPVILFEKIKFGIDVGEDRLSGKSPPEVPISFWFWPTALTFVIVNEKLTNVSIKIILRLENLLLNRLLFLVAMASP